MIIEPAERAARAIGSPPVGAEFEAPPLAPVAHILDRMLWRAEHQRAGPEHVRKGARIVLRIWCDLGEGDVTGGSDKFSELAICHRRAVDPECVDRHMMGWRLLRVVFVRTHAEGAAGNPDHINMS